MVDISQTWTQDPYSSTNTSGVASGAASGVASGAASGAASGVCGLGS